MTPTPPPSPPRVITPTMQRRSFLRSVAAGTVVMAFGGSAYLLADDAEERRARSTLRPDGRPRLPPSQYLLKRLRPMGGEEGDPSPGSFRLRVHGEVDHPLLLDLAELLAMPQTEQECDVHCVTKWSVLGARFTGVRVADLAQRAGVRGNAHHVIFEAAHGYSTNVPLHEAIAPNVLVAHRLDGTPLGRPHGAPLRAVVPDLYFWKSAKWLTAIRFSADDAPGYWETRGYHNHADPWKEERYG